MNNCPNVYQFTEIPSLRTFFIDFDASTSMHEATIVHHDIGQVINEVAQQCKFLIAAGGLVKHSVSGQYLFIKRLGKWDLPKGKMEAGETVALCAVREVEEECGIRDLTLGELLFSSYHTYWIKGQFIVKQTVWFAMTTNQFETQPQSEEQITETCWMNTSDFAEILANTYPSITQLLGAVSHQ